MKCHAILFNFVFFFVEYDDATTKEMTTICGGGGGGGAINAQTEVRSTYLRKRKREKRVLINIFKSNWQNLIIYGN